MLDNNILHNQLISRRTFIIGAGKLGLVFLLACRLFYMQFIKKDEYKTLSDKNRIRIVVIPSLRGKILDRNGKILAQNQPCFKLLLEKSGNPQYLQEIEFVSKLLELDDDQKSDLIQKVKKASNSMPAIVIDYLEWKELAVIEEQKNMLKSIFVDIGYNRHYPLGKDAAHVIGYIGRSNTDTSTIDYNFKVGLHGIEKSYEEDLKGQFGYKQLEVNAKGKFVRSIAKSDTIDGTDVELNIDSEIQTLLTQLLSPFGASAVLMNCENGAVLGLNSAPNFEPNNFNQLSSKYWNSLTSNPYYPLINKAIQSTYPPGSVFKIITALAALAKGFDPDKKISCTGGPMLGGNSFRCAKKGGHGLINLQDALKYSCNSYIFEVAKNIGIDSIIDMAKKFEFGQKTGIDLPGEKNGFVPTRDWKYSKTGEKWSLGDTLNMSIGQGFLLATPIQLARMISAIASNGKLFTPKILRDKETIFSKLDIPQSHLEFIKSALYRATNEIGGTSYFCRLDYEGNKMSGKTGTAQVQSKKNANDDLSRANIALHRRNHAIFIGYAPDINPKYAVSIYYDHGGSGGAAAAPIARKVLELALKLKV